MIRHEMLAFYKALYSVCLKPYASKLPTAFIQKEYPSFVWCISCLISENNALMRHCTIVQMISICCLDCIHSVSDLRFQISNSHWDGRGLYYFFIIFAALY